MHRIDIRSAHMQRRYFLWVIFLFAFAATKLALADVVNPNAHPLLLVMQELGPRFGIMGRQLSDPSRNEASRKLAREVEALVVQARNLLPERVEQMSDGPEKTALIAEYRALQGELLKEIRDVILALQSDDNATAQAAVARMKEIRKRGHDRFNP